MSLPPPTPPARDPTPDAPDDTATLDEDVPVQPAEAALAALAEHWDLIVRECSLEGRPVLAAALTGRTLSLREGTVVVGVPLAPEELEKHRRFLERRLARELGRQRVAVEALDRGKGVTDDRRRRYQAAEEAERVTWLVRTFGAEIIGRELVDRESWLSHLKAEREG